MNKNNTSNKLRIDAVLFCLSILLIIFLYGVAVGNYKLFPFAIFESASEGFDELKLHLRQAGLITEHTSDKKPSLFFIPVKPPFPPAVTNTSSAMSGVNLVTKMDGINVVAEILDMDGKQLHVWDVLWSRVWPDTDHIPEHLVPKAIFGAPIHGAVVMENGDLIYNYEHLGLVRMGKDSEVVWRLPYRTHHSVVLHDNGNLWVSGQKQLHKKDPLFPFRPKNADKYTILEISSDGEIINEWFVADILHNNGYGGLLHLDSILPSAFAKPVEDDRLHLNDVEPFPETFDEGFFVKGDVLVSLRNINTVFVFNTVSGKIKYINTGMFINQHDADFIDGNRFSIFDNNYRKGKASEDEKHSRIVIVSPENSTISVYYEGKPETPFYSNILGKHQWLENGNLLVTESMRGRAFEVDSRGEIVWEYLNYTGEGVVSVVQQVHRYPLQHGGFTDQDPINQSINQ